MSDQERLISAYFQLMNINGAAHAYRQAVQSGLLEQVVAAPRPAAELAAACGLAERPTALLLETLVPLGVLAREGAEYRATALALVLLSSSYKNLGDEYWSHLPALLQTGQPLTRMDNPATSEAHYQAQVAMLGWMLTPAAEFAARALSPALPAGAAILDLGAGSAVWSLTLAQLAGSASVTAVDWPAVLAVAVERAESLGLQDRLSTIAGNYHEVELPAGRFDLVIAANIAHLETPAGNQKLFARSHAALKPGGRLVVIDAFAGQPQGDLNRTLYALGLALRTTHGHVYSADELTPLLDEAGFATPELVPIAVPPYVVGMLIASKV